MIIDQGYALGNKTTYMHACSRAVDKFFLVWECYFETKLCTSWSKIRKLGKIIYMWKYKL